MAPRKTQQKATATARGTSNKKSDATASSRTPTPLTARWWSIPVAVIAVVAVFVAAYYPVAQVQYRETRQREQLRAELLALKARNARLRKQVDRLRTPEGVEDQARTQLGLVKRGEHVVVVNDGRTSQPTTNLALALPEIDSDYMSEEPVGPWTAFLDLFFNVQ